MTDNKTERMRERTSLETAETARGCVVCQDKRWGLNTAVWFKNHSEKSFGRGQHLLKTRGRSSLYYSKCFRFIKSSPFPSTHPTFDMSSKFLTVIPVSRKKKQKTNRLPVASVEEMFNVGEGKRLHDDKQPLLQTYTSEDSMSSTLVPTTHYTK